MPNVDEYSAVPSPTTPEALPLKAGVVEKEATPAVATQKKAAVQDANFMIDTKKDRESDII